jgi:hypothetical protein
MPDASARKVAAGAAAVAAVALAIAGGAIWTQVGDAGGSKPVAWTDVTARMPGLLWPKSVTRSFWKRRQVVRFLARTFPEGPPPVPAFDFSRYRLVLVAAGPRSSTGYGVRILRVRERRGDVRVLAREIAPQLGQRVEAKLTSPYRLIEIPATGKRVYFAWQGRP